SGGTSCTPTAWSGSSDRRSAYRCVGIMRFRFQPSAPLSPSPSCPLAPTLCPFAHLYSSRKSSPLSPSAFISPHPLSPSPVLSPHPLSPSPFRSRSPLSPPPSSSRGPSLARPP